jgi:hypothetical protein
LCLISNSGDGQWVRKNSRTAFSYSVGVIVLTLSGLSPIFHIAPYAAQPACMQWRKTISGSHMPTDRQPRKLKICRNITRPGLAVCPSACKAAWILGAP